MTGREIIDYILDRRGLVVTIGSGNCATFDEHFRNDWAGIIESEIQKRTSGLLDAVIYEKENKGGWQHRAEMLERQLGYCSIAKSKLKTLLRAWYQWHADSPVALVPDKDYWFVAETSEVAFNNDI